MKQCRSGIVVEKVALGADRSRFKSADPFISLMLFICATVMYIRAKNIYLTCSVDMN